MGWLFSNGWSTKKELIDYLCRSEGGHKTLKKSIRGNRLWILQEYQKDGAPVRYIVLMLMGKHPDGYGWGYKDIDESMGPYEVDCPLSYLDDLTPAANDYSRDWRSAVRKFHELRRAA